MQKLILELKRRLKKAFERNKAKGLLFSGGLDTSILAYLNPHIKAITVSLESFGEDIKYARVLARELKLEHFHRSIKIDEAIESIPEVIRLLKSFDPAIPNDLPVYFGLKVAKEMGIEEVMTGDGADELFAGYDYMKDIDNLDRYIKRITSSMSFNSNLLGDFFEIKISQPYLDREFINFALDVPVEFKIREENNKLWGKWILRKAFEDDLPREIIRQGKRPLEYGSGMNKIREIISKSISDREFERKSSSCPVRFINKEHLYFYEIYRDVAGEIPGPGENEKACPYCKGGMGALSAHCRICGGVLNAEWKKGKA